MNQINRIELRGNVGSVRRSDTTIGKMARLSLATNYLYRNSDGEAGVETTWHNVVAYESKTISAETLNRIERGSVVYLVGRVRSSRFTGGDGIERQIYEVVADKIRIIPDEEEE